MEDCNLTYVISTWAKDALWTKLRKCNFMMPLSECIKGISCISEIKIAQRWSGACSIPFDVRSQVGTLHNGRISYAYGYSGAGVMMSQIMAEF